MASMGPSETRSEKSFRTERFLIKICLLSLGVLMALCVRDNDATISSGARVTRRTILDDGAGALVSSDSVDSESARDSISALHTSSTKV